MWRKCAPILAGSSILQSVLDRKKRLERKKEETKVAILEKLSKEELEKVTGGEIVEEFHRSELSS